MNKMLMEEEFFENYYLDEEEIISYSDIDSTLRALVKSKEIIEKSFKYLNYAIK